MKIKFSNSFMKGVYLRNKKSYATYEETALQTAWKRTGEYLEKAIDDYSKQIVKDKKRTIR